MDIRAFLCIYEKEKVQQALASKNIQLLELIRDERNKYMDKLQIADINKASYTRCAYIVLLQK